MEKTHKLFGTISEEGKPKGSCIFSPQLPSKLAEKQNVRKRKGEKRKWIY